MAYAFIMNPYSAPAEVREPNPIQDPRDKGYWLFWLTIGVVLVLVSIPLFNSAVYRGPVSSELLAAIVWVAGIGCFNQALETSKRAGHRDCTETDSKQGS